MTDVLAPPTCAISVVVCAYTEERWDEINAAVASLRTQSIPAEEIILVVDHCPSLLARARRAFADIHVIASVGRPGLSGARNTGYEAAHGDVVAFLDDDATAAPDWLEQLQRTYQDGEVAGVGGLVVPNWVDHRPGWFPEEFDWVVGCSHSGMPSATADVRNFVGANMSFRRDVLVGLGGFAGVLGRNGADASGCEETELCIRASTWHEHSRLVYEPAARVEHRVPRARGTWKYFLRRCYGEGKSKALVRKIAGAQHGLSEERIHVRRTIPLAVARSIGEALRGRPVAGLRAVANVTGTGVTVLGYAVGRAALLRGTARPHERLAPPTAKRLAPGRIVVRTWLGGTALGAGALTLGLALWITTMVRGVPLGRMSDLGLVSVLPATYWAALVLVTVSFCSTVRRMESSKALLVAHVVLLLAILHLTPNVLYETLRYSWAWKHVAITNGVIAHHGVNTAQPDPNLVAYQDWPGFFTLNALFSSGSGFASPLSYAGWAPFVSELSYAGPLILIFRTFSADQRIRWTALWIFYLGNWVGQDYFSPQGYAYFLYLTVIALCLRHFASARAGASSLDVGPAAVEVAEEAAEQRRHDRRLYYLFTVIIIAAVASSHQLTPFMIVSALALLALFGRLRYKSLPVVALALTVGWIAFAARTFMKQNIPSLIKGFGDLLSNTAVQMVNPGQASSLQLFGSEVDRLLTAAVILLGAFGFLWRWRNGQQRAWFSAALLCASPMLALAANNYGGEIVFRVVLFALPFLAVLAASLFVPARHRPGRRHRVHNAARLAVVAALLGGFIISYYGKERTNYFPPEEVQSFSALYRLAPPGSLIVAATGNQPWPLENYETYSDYYFTADTPQALADVIKHPVAVLAHDLTARKDAFLVFDTTDDAVIESTGLMPRGAYGAVERAVLASPRFKVLLRNSTTVVLELASRGASTTQPVNA